MNRRLVALITASSIAFGVAGGVSAQSMQLEDSVMSGLSQLGVGVPDGVMLTDMQIAEIENVLGSTDDNSDRVARIERILAQGTVSDGGMNTQMLRDSVAISLAAMGYTDVDADMLSLMQVSEIENVTGSSDDATMQKARIDAILGGTMEGVGMSHGSRMLMDSVSSDLSSLGVSTDGLEMLSLSQLAEIENITGSTDSDEIKRDRIGVLMGN